MPVSWSIAVITLSGHQLQYGSYFIASVKTSHYTMIPILQDIIVVVILLVVHCNMAPILPPMYDIVDIPYHTMMPVLHDIIADIIRCNMAPILPSLPPTVRNCAQPRCNHECWLSLKCFLEIWSLDFIGDWCSWCCWGWCGPGLASRVNRFLLFYPREVTLSI